MKPKSTSSADLVVVVEMFIGTKTEADLNASSNDDAVVAGRPREGKINPEQYTSIQKYF